MRELTPAHVLTILIDRTEKRADTLEAVRLSGYDMAVSELRNVARWMRDAREYLEKSSGQIEGTKPSK